MWVNFTFSNGSCPYITKTRKELFRMLNKYEVTQTGSTAFHVIREKKPAKTYSSKKELIRNIAIEWQNIFPDFSFYQTDCIGWECFFREYGKKFGLLSEFHENGII